MKKKLNKCWRLTRIYFDTRGKMGIALGQNGHSLGAKWAYVNKLWIFKTLRQYGPQQLRLGNGLYFCACFVKCILVLSFVLLFFQKYVIKIKPVFTRLNVQNRIFRNCACYHYCGDKYNTIASPSAISQKHLPILPQA